MEIVFNADKRKSYELNISYHYFVQDKIDSRLFYTLESFEEFMNECHPGISISKFIERFNSELAKLLKKSNEPNFDNDNRYVCLNCGICGDELFVSRFNTGVIERIQEFKEAREKVNEGYIQTVLANTWSFNTENGIMRVKYWYDPSNEDVYKIHAFKDKIILETNYGRPSSVINCNNYYIHCEGNKKIN